MNTFLASLVCGLSALASYFWFLAVRAPFPNERPITMERSELDRTPEYIVVLAIIAAIVLTIAAVYFTLYR